MNTPETVRLLGNSLCLDFANSVDWSQNEPIKDEVLNEPDDLRRWGVRLGLGDSKVPDGEELRRALDLRAALHRTFAAIAHGEDPAAADLESIAAQHAEATGTARITPTAGGSYGPTWPKRDARRVRYAVVADAIALLADAARLDRVRHGPGHDCGWLFLDVSGRRRWCTMDTCGSRAKMRRLYERRRAAAASG